MQLITQMLHKFKNNHKENQRGEEGVLGAPKNPPNDIHCKSTKIIWEKQGATDNFPGIVDNYSQGVAIGGGSCIPDNTHHYFIWC